MSSSSLPPNLRESLRVKVVSRWVEGQEDASGWQGLFHVQDDDMTGEKVLVSSCDLQAGEVGSHDVIALAHVS